MALEFFCLEDFASTTRDLCKVFDEDGDYAAKK
jgi:hypothetical protein